MTDDPICRLIGLDYNKREDMARYFAKLSERERIECFKLAFDLAKQYMAKAADDIRGKPDFFFSMFCLSAWKMNWIRVAMAKKNPDLSADQTKEIYERRLSGILSARKDRMKRGRLSTLLDVRLYNVIKQLRNDKLSWRECSEFLRKNHRTKISYVHLRRLFMKLTDERALRGESNEF